jgi:acyl carrier protein
MMVQEDDMDRQQVLLELDEILELTPGTLTGAEELDGLASWDSLAMMNVIAFASDRFEMTLSPRQIGPCRTIGDLVQLMGVKIAQA